MNIQLNCDKDYDGDSKQDVRTHERAGDGESPVLK